MSDIVERLRANRGAGNDHWQDVWEAADEIERLREAVTAEREACIADVFANCSSDNEAERIASSIRARGKGET